MDDPQVAHDGALTELLEAEPERTPGGFDLEDGQCRWDADEVTISRGSRTLRFAEGRFKLQISRSRAIATAKRGDRFWERASPHVHTLHVELRDGEARWIVSAHVEAPRILEGLPWQARSEGDLVGKADLLALLTAARSLGAQVLSWAPEQAEHIPDTIPDRMIPLGVAARLVLWREGTSIAWFVHILMMAIALVMLPPVDFHALWFQPDAHVTGEVVDVDNTGISVLDEDVYGVTFDYEVADATRRATSYHRGGSLPETGETVDVEYELDDPDDARIVGTTMSPSPTWFGLTMLLPLTSFGALLIVMLMGLRMLRVLEHGPMGIAIFESETCVDDEIQTSHSFEMRFTITTPDQTSHTLTRTMSRPPGTSPERQKRVLYAKRWPERAVFIDDELPDKINVDEDATGGLRFSTRGGWVAFIAPLIVLAQKVALIVLIMN